MKNNVLLVLKRITELFVSVRGKGKTNLKLYSQIIPISAAALLAAPAHAQSTNKVEVSSGWEMQDATIVEKEAKSIGWYKENAAQVSQEGEVLSKADYKPQAKWYPATVPGTVLTTLVNNGVYPEPLFGENNRPEKIPEELCRKDWWYRTTVEVPESYKGKLVWLNFDGINYAADIWVNGKRVGPIKGAFIRGIFDITKFVENKKEAVIAVRISPQPNPGIPAEHSMGTFAPCGGRARVDGPTFGCSVGWDWIPGIRDRNSGIWSKVYLTATDAVIVKDPFITTDINLPKLDEAFVNVQATVQNATEKAQKGVIKGRIGDVVFEKQVELKPWYSATVDFTSKEFPQLRFLKPKLWWPNGLGEPNLYTLHLAFEIDGKESDARDVNFGIRKITYDIPDSKNLALSVNGVRVFCKGGNWGMEEALKRISYERLDAQVRMHRDANYNMIRNWGGQSTSDALYELCDKYGILLWDEFFQFNTADPFDTDLMMANIKDKILRYRNHPSLAVWCGRNEATPPKYLNDAMRYMLIELDPTRHYQANSGHEGGCNSGGPYDWQSPMDLYKFSELKRFNSRETFKTEIGAISVPTLESVQEMLPKEDQNNVTNNWGERDFAAGGGRKYIKETENRYGKIANLADFVRKAQMMNFEYHRALYEGRLGKMFTPTQGILLWMSLPAQPSFVWQIIPYDLEPNASFYGVKKACEQLHIQFNETDGGIIQIVNHYPKAVSNAKAKLTLYNLDGTVALQKSYTVNAPASAVTKLDAIEWPENLSQVHFVKLELGDIKGKVISDNFYWRAKSNKPNDLTALESMPQVQLTSKANARLVNGKAFIEVTLTNPTANIALMAHLQLQGEKSKKRILPAFYSDNYISLAPKESKTITIEFDEAKLKGEKPVVLVDGWNVKVADAGLVAFNKNTDLSKWKNTGFTYETEKLVPQKVVRVNCSGYNRGNFSKDPGFLEGSMGFYFNYINVDTPNAAPEMVYSTVRWLPATYTSLMAGKPGQKYKVRLHFAELDKNTTEGKRVFNIKINGNVVIQDLDVYKETGSPFKALVKEVSGIVADDENKITIQTVDGKRGAPQISGFEIIPE